MLLVAFFYYSWGSPLGNLQRPEESLERLVSREMDLDQSFEHLHAEVLPSNRVL